ncbi:MAG: hypothetical protein JW850_07705 [Thermoflexales bacterium]|nr:hypothetical protein [Thermoflexales bacterium]
MATQVVTKDEILRSLNDLPVSSWGEVYHFIEFLRSKAQRRPTASAEQIQAVLMETFGMWADRTDIPADSIEYVNQIRRGYRLEELGLFNETD